MAGDLSSDALIGPSSLAQGRWSGGVRWRQRVTTPPLEAVVTTPSRDGDALHHYRRAQDRPDRGWQRLDVIAPRVEGPGAIATAGDLRHVLVPEAPGVVHYVLDRGRWARAGLVGPGRTVSVATVGKDLFALLSGDDGTVLWSFDGRWRPVASLDGTHGVIASDFRGRLTALVSGDDVRRHAFSKGRWTPGDRVAAAGSALPALAWTGSTWLVAVPRGDSVATYRRTDDEWRKAETLTWGVGQVRGVALAASRLHDWVQALTDEEGSLFHHHRQVAAGDCRWMRSACLRVSDPDPFVVDRVESIKLAQVSGEADSQPTPWGERRPTLSRSESTAGVRGTDLGVRVDHAGRTFLLFGDTHWRFPWLTTRDAIAEVVPGGPAATLPQIRFHGSPLRVSGGRVTMREYDVPLDAFSLEGQFFAFFSSHHFDREQTMGRSVLARAVDPSLPIDPRARWRPVRFRFLTTISTRHFMNVSVQPFPAAAVPGFGGDHDLLLIWGSGAYRAGDLRLAVLDPARPGVRGSLLRAGRVRPAELGLRYWAGLDAGESVWAEHEEQARPLLHPGAFGEISVRWVPQVRRFLLLSGAGPEDPIGPAITLRTAPNPWGPWSPRRRLLDWIASGMAHHDPFSRFIKAHADGSDPVGDRIFRAQADVTGAAYAPYFFDAAVSGNHLVLRYTLSTWNPYQVVLMAHHLPLAEIADVN